MQTIANTELTLVVIRPPFLCVLACIRSWNIIYHHPTTSRLLLSALRSSLSVSCEAVSSASSQPKVERRRRRKKNLEHDARRCQESLLRWHLDLHISFSWVTKYINTRFKLRSLASCSLPAHTLMQTHTHAYIHTALTIFIFFWDEFKKGEGDKTSSLWSMQLV